MKLRTLLLLGMSSAMLAACGWFHAGPGERDIDAAVRRALDAENRGPLNSMLGQPLPVAADVASVKPVGDCTKVAERTYSCNVAITWHDGRPDEGDASLRTTLTFTEGSDGAWQTSHVDAALAAGAAKSLIDRISGAIAASGASQPQ
ncbi:MULTISPECIES: hypothetical protein [Burkholderia]|uniref:Lipoprotein n=1 Tax=Burkholderia savannae TaxID=1637837 RepID=A0ABR5TDE9_9BURK|nr:MULTISPECIES: hypothetical protein [Burkholderia]AOJ68811.1 hypothetical protein WS78_08620 [Burkholderia savannae]AOJ80786.1 hypothetical protein WS86_09285 [Burkholderia savannae]AOK47025.1 hypothetical protein WT60_09340 [Burkholderia sp. MSMB617WGS]KVG45680.1 hypothetical protein WS77_06160 [Burkholderia sp. MSMB0265]KVG87655.1 hypothetical protein WS81_26630 [Burkholderia sp. MSMB2040]